MKIHRIHFHKVILYTVSLTDNNASRIYYRVVQPHWQTHVVESRSEVLLAEKTGIHSTRQRGRFYRDAELPLHFVEHLAEILVGEIEIDLHPGNLSTWFEV